MAGKSGEAPDGTVYLPQYVLSLRFVDGGHNW